MENGGSSVHVHDVGATVIERILSEERVSFSESFQFSLLQFLSSICNYEEEGTKIPLNILIGNRIDSLLAYIPNKRLLHIVDGQISGNDLERNLRRLARFCIGDWTIVIDVREDVVAFSICKVFSGPTGFDLIDLIFDNRGQGQSAIFVQRSSRDEVTIFGSKSGCSKLQLRFARANYPVYSSIDSELIIDTTESVSNDNRDYVRKVARRLFRTIEKRVHGAILLLVKNNSVAIPELADGIYFQKPVDLAQAAIDLSNGSPNLASSEEFDAVSGLLFEMLNVDGITIVDDLFRIIAYNVFLRTPATEDRRLSGGARRRTADTLCSMTNPGIVGVYFISQDGQTFYKRKSNG